MIEPIQEVAQELQLGQPELNFIVAKVNCVHESAGKICDFMQTTALPSVIVLRPDQGKYYRIWSYAEDTKDYNGIMDFIMGDYNYAYTQGDLLSLTPLERLSVTDGYQLFLQKMFHAAMEENYEQLYDMGLVGTPVESYAIVKFFAILAFLSPMLAVFYFFGLYKIYKYFTNKW